MYLRHVTLTTGHARDCPRDEVTDEAVALCRSLLTRAAAGERVAVPGIGLTLTALDASRACITLDVMQGEALVCVIAIATHSRCGSSAWRRLHAEADQTVITTGPDDCPPEPWVAARLEAGAALVSPEALMMLGDLERCLGWAWIEMTRG